MEGDVFSAQSQVTGNIVGELPFHVAKRSELVHLFSVLRLGEAPKELVGLVEQTQPWVRGDHSRPEYKHNITESQVKELFGIFPNFGLTDRVDFPAERLEQIVVLGAIHHGNNRRAYHLKQNLDHGTTTGRIVLLGGERLMYPEVERPEVDANIEGIIRRGEADRWLEQLSRLPNERIDETHLIRLAVAAQIGPLVVRQLHIRTGPVNEGHRPILRYELTSDAPPLDATPITLLHTQAVDRPNGKKRHTTEACIRDWLYTFPDIPHRAKVGFIGAQPHLRRMVRSAQRMLIDNDRGDIQLVMGGPEVSPETRYHIYLGEIARSLYEDLQFSKNTK